MDIKTKTIYHAYKYKDIQIQNVGMFLVYIIAPTPSACEYKKLTLSSIVLGKLYTGLEEQIHDKT